MTDLPWRACLQPNENERGWRPYPSTLIAGSACEIVGRLDHSSLVRSRLGQHVFYPNALYSIHSSSTHKHKPTGNSHENPAGSAHSEGAARAGHCSRAGPDRPIAGAGSAPMSRSVTLSSLGDSAASARNRPPNNAQRYYLRLNFITARVPWARMPADPADCGTAAATAMVVYILTTAVATVV